MENFYITTKDIWSDDWSDPIYFDFRGIDPSLFFDDDGRVYVQGSWRDGALHERLCTIKQFEIDIQTGKALSEIKLIWDGWAKGNTEGPHVYKKDGYYFFLVAEAGTFDHHLIAIARSRSIWGPYESSEKNPILTADGKDEYVQNTGHRDLLQDHEGEWWIAVLGVRNEDGRFPLGRETFLTLVTWPKGGWLQIEQPRMKFQRKAVASATRDIEHLLSKKWPKVEDVYIRNANAKDYQFSDDGRTITLLARSTGLSTPMKTASFLGSRQSLDCTTTVTLKLDNGQNKSSLKARLAVYKDDFRHADIYYDYTTSNVVSYIWNKLKGAPIIAQQPADPSESVSFKIKATAKMYESLNQTKIGADWTLLGELDTIDMTACDFTGTIFGVFAISSKEQEGALATFTDFQIVES